MLKPAQLYKDELNKKMIEGWYDIDNMYYHGGPSSYELDFGDNNKNCHSFVSVKRRKLGLETIDTIIGFISYEVDWEAMSADNFGFISFDKGNAVLVSDAVKCIRDLFIKYNMNRVAWYCYADNPALEGYRKLVKRFGGKEVGYLRQSNKLLDGKLHDSVIFEILKSDLKQ